MIHSLTTKCGNYSLVKLDNNDLIFNIIIDGKVIEEFDDNFQIISELYPYFKGQLISHKLEDKFSYVKDILCELFKEAEKNGFFQKVQCEYPLIFTTIRSYCDNFELTALINIKGNYDMPSFKFKCDNEDVLWDAQEYLIGDFLKYLKGDINDEELDRTFKYIKDEILNMFKHAIRIGFFVNTP